MAAATKAPKKAVEPIAGLPGLRVSASRTALLEACELAYQAVSRHSIKPILQCFHLAGKGTQLAITGTDLERGAVVFLDLVEIKQPGSLVVDASTFLEALRRLEDETIGLEHGQDKLKFTTDAGDLSLQVLDSEDYPEIPVPGLPYTCRIDSDVLRTLYGQIRLVPKTDNSGRWAMSAVKWALTDKQLELSGTDGRIAVIVDGPVLEACKDQPSNDTLVLPSWLKTVLDASKSGEAIDIWINQAEIFARTERALIYSRLIEGRHPKIREVLKSNHKTKATVKVLAGKLAKACRQAELVCDDEDRALVFRFDSFGIEIKPNRQGKGNARILVQAEVEHADKVSLHTGLLQQLLRTLPADELVTLQTGGDTPTVLIRPNYLAMIQPMSES